jgi:hypothetical protein
MAKGPRMVLSLVVSGLSDFSFLTIREGPGLSGLKTRTVR